MHFLPLLTATLATVVSAYKALQDTGVTFYEHVNYQGFQYTIPSLNRCWRLPETLFQRVSSVRFNNNRVSCAVYRNGVCFPPVLYAGLRESVRDLHEVGMGDEIGSVYCTGIQSEEEWL